jgi:hypothetical protein
LDADFITQVLLYREMNECSLKMVIDYLSTQEITSSYEGNQQDTNID